MSDDSRGRIWKITYHRGWQVIPNSGDGGSISRQGSWIPTLSRRDAGVSICKAIAINQDPLMNRLHKLHDAGVSIWLDFIERTMLHNGDLERRIREEALTGMTSNPTIFEKALAEGTAYDAQLRDAPPDCHAWELFELVATTDVRDACDRFRRRLRPHEGRRRLRLHRGIAGRGERRRGHGGRGVPAVEGRAASEPVCEDPRHRGGSEGGASRDRRRHQRQHHAALRARGARSRDRRVHERAGRPRQEEPADRHARVGRELLRVARGYRGGQAPRRAAGIPS